MIWLLKDEHGLDKERKERNKAVQVSEGPVIKKLIISKDGEVQWDKKPKWMGARRMGEASPEGPRVQI